MNYLLPQSCFGDLRKIDHALSVNIFILPWQVLTCSRKQEDIDDLVKDAKEKGLDVQVSISSRICMHLAS